MTEGLANTVLLKDMFDSLGAGLLTSPWCATEDI